MNYAEDRLDRRARMIDLIEDGIRSMPILANEEEEEEEKGGVYPLQQNLSVFDSNLRHPISVNTHCNKETPTSNSILPTWSRKSLVVDLNHAHGLINQTMSTSNHIEEASSYYNNLKMGHELAGRTLRDCGLCSQASFHYAMAWMCDAADADRAGDYAQMAEFCGRTDVGIHSLLFYRSGQKFCHDFFTYCRQIKILSYDKQKDYRNFLLSHDTYRNSHCGCGFDPCGKREFYIPYDMEIDQISKDTIEKIDRLEFVLYNEPIKTKWNASTVYEKAFASIPTDHRGTKNTADERLYRVCFDILRFWESPRDPLEEDDDLNNNTITTIIPSECATDDSAQHTSKLGVSRILPPLLQILMLKLLYVYPKGGSFLYLACEAVPHISANIYRSYNLSQIMACRYKSHWAYFTFIRSIVLGERMKKHRRKHIPYHIPVWDIVHDLDSRYHNPSVDFKYHQSQVIKPMAPTFAPFLNQLSDQNSCLHKPLFAVGDSHVISIGWQTIRVSSMPCDQFRLIVPLPVTGLKAWHVREGTKFFTHYNLHKILGQLPSWCRSIIFSAGEIDCREGIGGERLEGYGDRCTEEVIRTAREYVRALEFLSHRYSLQILVMPIAPHAARNDKNGRKLGRARRRERMMCWNEALREECKLAHYSRGQALFFLDYEMQLRYPENNSVGFVLNPAYNSDFTHMNAAFLSHFEEAFHSCDCVLQLV